MALLEGHSTPERPWLSWKAMALLEGHGSKGQRHDSLERPWHFEKAMALYTHPALITVQQVFNLNHSHLSASSYDCLTLNAY